MILPVPCATATASSVSVMSGMHDMTKGYSAYLSLGEIFVTYILSLRVE